MGYATRTTLADQSLLLLHHAFIAGFLDWRADEICQVRAIYGGFMVQGKEPFELGAAQLLLKLDISTVLPRSSSAEQPMQGFGPAVVQDLTHAVLGSI